MRICNIYSSDLPNVGDQYCNPSRYFEFPCQVDDSAPLHFLEIIKNYDYFIYGGGGHIHIPSPDYNNGRFGHLEVLLPFAHKIIIWGVGHNVGHTKEIKYPDYMDTFLFVGLRDYQAGDRFVACASCMDKAFNKKYLIKDKIRAFSKPGKLVEGIHPGLCDGRDLTLTEAVKFLGEAEIIITNSWHGAYWSLLLGKEVIIQSPDSSKFYGLTEEYEEKSDGLYLHPPKGYLNRCRRSNKEYHSRIIDFLKDK